MSSTPAKYVESDDFLSFFFRCEQIVSDYKDPFFKKKQQKFKFTHINKTDGYQNIISGRRMTEKDRKKNFLGHADMRFVTIPNPVLQVLLGKPIAKTLIGNNFIQISSACSL